MPISINGSGSITGISAGGLPSGTVTPASLSTGAPSWDSSGNVSTNSGFGSNVVEYGCRAWVYFDGTVAGTFAGGASTVTRVAGSTTATVTTTNAHGLSTGNVVRATSGVAAGNYTVTVLTPTTFTVTTTATTALNAVTIAFSFVTVRGSGNVNSVAKLGTGDYAVNFTTVMPDANYGVNISSLGGAALGTGSPIYGIGVTLASPVNIGYVEVDSSSPVPTYQDVSRFYVSIFR